MEIEEIKYSFGTKKQKSSDEYWVLTSQRIKNVSFNWML